MSDDPRLDWYLRLYDLIVQEAATATADGLFNSPDAMHVNLIGAPIAHLIACCETAEDLERVVQIVRTAEAAALARSRLLQPTMH
jgi:hypothetical protein